MEDAVRTHGARDIKSNPAAFIHCPFYFLFLITEKTSVRAVWIKACNCKSPSDTIRQTLICHHIAGLSESHMAREEEYPHVINLEHGKRIVSTGKRCEYFSVSYVRDSCHSE